MLLKYRAGRLARLMVVGSLLSPWTLCSAVAHAEPEVVVSIKPIHSLVTQVMDGIGTPKLLVSGAASPHTYAMKPSDSKALNGAAVFFRISSAIEPFTEKIVGSLPKSVRVVTLADAKGLTLWGKRSGSTFEGHDHAEGVDHDHHDDHDAEDSEHGDGQEKSITWDGHIWLDPENAKTMVAEIAAVLTEVSPGNAEKFKTNASRVIGQLDALRSEIAHELEPVKRRPFVVFHDAYQYFERRFELQAVGSITVSPEVQPSAKRLSEIRAKLTTLKASCVFAEPNFSPGLIANVLEGTTARSGVLDPEGTAVADGVNAYFDLMRGLSASMKSCLSDPG